MGDGLRDGAGPDEILLRWLWQAMFGVVVFSLCSVLQAQHLLHASTTLTPPTVMRLALWMPTYLLLRSKRLPIRDGWRWAILLGLALATLVQFALVPSPGPVERYVLAADAPLAGLALALWSLRGRSTEAP